MELAEQVIEYVGGLGHLSSEKRELTPVFLSLYDDRSQPLCDVRTVSPYGGPHRFRFARPVRSHLGHFRIAEEALGRPLVDLRRPNGPSQPEPS